ncbi:MAG: hypothetical protein LQ337_001594 [Flavoplaca oasis]|nr:MAG: hypothetical protein LQ337_001594 [Flavoplaca oasis]
MCGAVHTEFVTITIHTAKCDLCNRHNTSEIFRCTKYGRHCCKPCWDSKGGSGYHTVNDQGRLAYTGPKAEPLPPVLSEVGKVDGMRKGKSEDRKDGSQKLESAVDGEKVGERKKSLIVILRGSPKICEEILRGPSNQNDVKFFERDSKNLKRKSLRNAGVIQHQRIRTIKKLPELTTGQEQASASQQWHITGSVIRLNKCKCRTFSKRIECQYFNLPEALGIKPFHNMSAKPANTSILETARNQRYALTEGKKQETVSQSHLASLHKATKAQRNMYVEERHRYQEQAREQTNRSRAFEQEVAQLERQMQTEERRRKAMKQDEIAWRNHASRMGHVPRVKVLLG